VGINLLGSRCFLNIRRFGLVGSPGYPTLEMAPISPKPLADSPVPIQCNPFSPIRFSLFPMNEDELANAIIERQKEDEQEGIEFGESDAERDIYTETHFNHYGNRGVVDLYIDQSGWLGHVYEFKSESAVEQATGANEILRQFNQIRKYFYKGSDHPVPSEIDFELCFTPTESNARHIIENAEMYANTVENDIANLRKDINVGTKITFRLPDPENIQPLLMFTGLVDFREEVGGGPFRQYAKSNTPEIYKRLKPVFDEYGI
jgi:hypothetical protein